MVEAHPGAQLDQPGGLGRGGRVGPDADLVGRPPQQRGVAHRLGRRHQQQRLGRRRQRPQTAREALLDAAGQGLGVGTPEPARQLGRAQPPGQLQQRQRVAPGLGDDAIAHPLVESPRGHRVEQGPGVTVVQSPHHQLGETGQLVLVAGPAHHEHQGQRLGQQPAGHEAERLRRRPIEPLGVVDQAHERLVAGRLRQQAQQRQPDEEAVGRLAGPQAQRRADGRGLGIGQLGQAAEHGRAQLVQPGERQLHLGLDPHRPGDVTPLGPVLDVVQQHRLAHPGLAPHHQDLALPGARLGQQAVQRLAFAAAAA
jgi:hypothetical protein